MEELDVAPLMEGIVISSRTFYIWACRVIGDSFMMFYVGARRVQVLLRRSVDP